MVAVAEASYEVTVGGDVDVDLVATADVAGGGDFDAYLVSQSGDRSRFSVDNRRQQICAAGQAIVGAGRWRLCFHRPKFDAGMLWVVEKNFHTND